ncbi:unnamed protein product, partial [Allacma fusca]
MVKIQDQELKVFFKYPNAPPTIIIKTDVELPYDTGFVVTDRRFSITKEYAHFDQPNEEDRRFVSDLLDEMGVRPVDTHADHREPVAAKRIYYNPKQDPKLKMKAVVKL